ncbi:hypothetical protein BH10PSE19_BH10PSE19_06950 [soil metagenome]
MTSLSIVMPDILAKASQEAAKHLGISRTEFIRQAVMHELANIQSQLERKAIIKSIQAMKKSKPYLQEVEEITEYFNSVLPNEDEEGWWSKKKF